MPRVTRRSQAASAVHTQGSSIEPVLPLQVDSENNISKPSPIQRANDLQGKKRTYSSYKASSEDHATLATCQPSTKAQFRAKKARKHGPNLDDVEPRGLLTENRGGSSSRGGEGLHNDDGFEDTRIGTGRVTFHPDRDDTYGNTHGSKRASTVHLDENELFVFGNVESDAEEEEDDWHDEAETTRCQPTRFSEAMAIERVSWQADATSSRPGSQNTRGSGDTLEYGVDTSPEPDGDVAHTTTVMRVWPTETNIIFSDSRTKMRLTGQQIMVRVVLQDAIENVHSHLVFQHAFPTAPDLVKSTRVALLDAARARSPRTAAIHERLIVDMEYLENMSIIPRARIPIIRRSIKERCSTMVAAEYTALGPSIEIADLVAKETDNYNYIYPVVRFGASLDERLLKRSQPYRNQRIINVIRDVYFTGGVSSFAKRFDRLFPRHRNAEGIEKTEVPMQMLALVATALYAAVYDWRKGEREPIDFTTGAYMDPYDGNVNTLKNMLANHPNKYHIMMADIYAKASPTGDRKPLPIADIPFHELDG